MERRNLVYGNTTMHLKASFFRAGGHPLGVNLVEVKLLVSKFHSPERSQILQPQNEPDVFGFLFPISHLISSRLQQVQVEYMISLIRHPYQPNVEYYWTRQISSFASVAARDVLVRGHNGFLMHISINIDTADRSPRPMYQTGSELVDETLILPPSEVGRAAGGWAFGGLPASECSVSLLETRRFEGVRERESKACSICLEDFQDGVEVTKMPCSHDFHRTCLRKWLVQGHLCPLCRFPLPTERCV